MNKYAFTLLALLASTDAKASEVGAPITQIANTPAILAIAIAEIGASATLAFAQDPAQSGGQERTDMDSYVDRAIEQISSQMEQKLFARLELLQSHY